MAEIDTVWMAFGLFLLACGAVPAAAALAIELCGQPPRRGAAIAAPGGRAAAALFHEGDRGAAPADLERVRGNMDLAASGFRRTTRCPGCERHGDAGAARGPACWGSGTT